jgi:hypothetical protein
MLFEFKLIGIVTDVSLFWEDTDSFRLNICSKGGYVLCVGSSCKGVYRSEYQSGETRPYTSGDESKPSNRNAITLIGTRSKLSAELAD